MTNPHVVALISCHNRRQATLACLASLLRIPEVRVEAVVVDDGSTDGTAEAIKAAFGETVTIVPGDGRLYWAGGMALAEQHARRLKPDFLLWLNDDVELAAWAVSDLIEVAEGSIGGAAVVGAVADPRSGEVSYSGLRRRDWHPMRYDRVAAAGTPVEVDTFNGNVVLVPRAVYEAVGPIDSHLVHSAADIDYGLRVKSAGFQNLLAPLVVGVCPYNGRIGLLSDPRIEKWLAFVGPKGVPPRPYGRFLRRHGGRLWPVFWCATYVKAVAFVALGRLPFSVSRLEAQRADRLAGGPSGHHVGRDVLGHQASRADDAAVADSDALQDDRPCADEDVVLDDNGIVGSRHRDRIEPPRQSVDDMEVRVGNKHVSSQKDALADRDARDSTDGGSAQTAVCADFYRGAAAESSEDHRPGHTQGGVAAARNESDALPDLNSRASLSSDDRTAQSDHVLVNGHPSQTHRGDPESRKDSPSNDGGDAIKRFQKGQGTELSSVKDSRRRRDVA